MSAGERGDSDANIFADNKIVNMAEKIILLTIINRMGFFDFAALSLSLFRYTVISLLRQAAFFSLKIYLFFSSLLLFFSLALNNSSLPLSPAGGL